jgi:glycosyltransferase involved in cell wall biosynthesis
MKSPVIAVVIPCFGVSKHILDVIRRVGPETTRIYVVDDRCPEGTGELVERTCSDPRVIVIRHPANLGVGGAVLTGYRRAVSDGADVIVKIDGDGQMDPGLLPLFTEPILAGEADYTKGNRFFHVEDARAMPMLRLVGNAVLSFMAKLSTGYWEIFDPTNGYTAIHARLIPHLPLEKIAKRYFFETDMLFRLNTMQAVVVDVPMEAVYGDERSNLRIARVLPEFAGRHLGNLAKRIFYGYFLRDFSLASIELLLSVALLLFGLAFGSYHWWDSIQTGKAAPIGTALLAAVPTLLGVQFGLGFLSFDMRTRPERPIHKRLARSAIKEHTSRN